jgi:hypothetical protein
MTYSFQSWNIVEETETGGTGPAHGHGRRLTSESFTDHYVMGVQLAERMLAAMKLSVYENLSAKLIG